MPENKSRAGKLIYLQSKLIKSFTETANYDTLDFINVFIHEPAYIKVTTSNITLEHICNIF
jgi:hypothetical protein